MVVIAVVILFLFLPLSFIIVNFLPGDPVMKYIDALGLPPTQAIYNTATHQLGYDLPVFLQFYKFLGDLMTGNWGISVSISQGTPVADLFMTNFPSMIEITLLPITLGIIVGIILGKLAIRYRGKWVDKTIRLIYILGISFPAFFLGMLFQYGIFITDSPLPILGWKNSIDPIPPVVTGFRIHDAILANQSDLVGDIILHYLIPGIILFIVTFSFITRQTRSMQENKSYGSSVISNTVITGSIFGFIVMAFFTVDLLFNLNSFSHLFLMALSLNEFWVLRICLFAIILEFLVVTFISNAIFILHKFVIKDRLEDKIKKKSRENVNNEDQNFKTSPEETLKSYLKLRLKSPMFIIGTFLVIFFIVSAIFPRLITQYTYHEALSGSPESWNPPSPGHLLGQTYWGMDVFARVMYGLRDSILFGFVAVLIGLIGGVGLGILVGRSTRSVYKPIMGLMIIFYILPAFLIVILLSVPFGLGIYNIMGVVGITLIPNITRAVANAMVGRFDVHKMGKAVIIQIPLNVALAILIYNSIGFLGFEPLFSINLGNDIMEASANHLLAPWAFLWPGFALFELIISFLILHVGLKGFDHKSRITEVLKSFRQKIGRKIKLKKSKV